MKYMFTVETLELLSTDGPQCSFGISCIVSDIDWPMLQAQPIVLLFLLFPISQIKQKLAINSITPKFEFQYKIEYSTLRFFAS